MHLVSVRPTLVVAVLLAAWCGAACAGDGRTDKERQLITQLRSAAEGERAIACKELAIHGSADAVPDVAKLLGDERLSSWAGWGRLRWRWVWAWVSVWRPRWVWRIRRGRWVAAVRIRRCLRRGLGRVRRPAIRRRGRRRRVAVGAAERFRVPVVGFRVGVRR
jgi:hypothetical protein